MQDNPRGKLQEALDALLVEEFGELTYAKDWVLAAHVVKLEDATEDEGTISIQKGMGTSIFAAMGLLQVANNTYQSEPHYYEEEEDE